MDIVLNNSELICIDGDARNLGISCHSGHLWVTQPGDPNDYLVGSGEQFVITRKGKIAVTALADARVRFTFRNKKKRACLPWQVQMQTI